jgi:glutathione synthase/RimK-type ligase-like ATP-grasp enzyme
MTNPPALFDVLIVYSGGLAMSAHLAKEKDNFPFSLDGPRKHYNNAYAYFLEICNSNGLSAAFSTSSDIIGAGTCSSYWLYDKKAWRKVDRPAYSKLIFDKFYKTKNSLPLRKLLFSSSSVKPFTSDRMHSLFSDKLKTYDELQEFTIPTVIIEEGSKDSIERALKELAVLKGRHPNEADFADPLVLKDRFGAGGNNIHKIAENVPEAIFNIMNKNKHISFVLQPFMRFESGYSYHDPKKSTDIRLIYHRGEIVQTYVREAKEGDFRCNEHQGGTLTYTSLKSIPAEIIKLSQKISQSLKDKDSLFALDFIVSNDGNVYLLEGNSRPGIDWDLSLEANEREAKQLIRGIVKELLRRVKVEPASISVVT